jgi:mono/diheme cytochrome c family protein
VKGSVIDHGPLNAKSAGRFVVGKADFDCDKVMTEWFGQRLFVRGLVALMVASSSPANADNLTQRGDLYDRHCLPCHGRFGDGLGPAAAWVWPRPRDLTQGVYKWRSRGDLPPSADDIASTIRFGTSSSMPGFGSVLSSSEIAQLVATVQQLAPTISWSSSSNATLIGSAGSLANGRKLWTDKGCTSCHGVDGKGATSTLATATVYDLTTTPLRRPRSNDTIEARRAAVVATLETGLDGTAMPSFSTALSASEKRDIAEFVVGLYHGKNSQSSAISLEAQHARDTAAQRSSNAGYWPGRSDDPDSEPFGRVIELQQISRLQLTPAQSSLAPEQCGRCHAAQFRQWNGSIHSQSMAPGVRAQIDEVARATPQVVESCQRCHAPLAEQQAQLSTTAGYSANPSFDPTLRQHGVACASCHVRQGRRFGPNGIAPSLLPLPNYPLTTLAVYQRSDFCLPCHQLPAATAVANTPLLNTYVEWLRSPYMAAGVQCQHCHMPNREHTFLGIHEPSMVKSALRVTATAAHRRGGLVEVDVAVENVAAGHNFPTTPTPAAFLVIELRDAQHNVIAGATRRNRIGRQIEFRNGAWRQIQDTRIAPGQPLRIRTAWRDGDVAAARELHVQIEVHPDDYYEHLYAGELGKQLPDTQRQLYQQAADRAKRSKFVAIDQTFAIAML